MKSPIHPITLLLLLGISSPALAQTLGTSRPVVGQLLPVYFTSTPGNLYVTHAAIPPLVSIKIPGISGILRLDHQSLISIYSGTVPATGTDRQFLDIPNETKFIGAKIALQALDVRKSANPALSNAIKLTFESAEPRPNIVLIVADDLGYGTLSSYGGKALATPNIDSIAKNGVRFTDAYVTAGSCSPSRAGMLTGRYQQRFGFEFNAGTLSRTINNPIGIDPKEKTLGDLMQSASYKTGLVGKWHLGVQKQFLPNGRGFEEFFGFPGGASCYMPCPTRGNPIESSIFRNDKPVVENTYLTDAFAREAVAFIDKHKSERFFLNVSFNAVHTPLEATNKYLQCFAHIADMDTRYYLAMTSALDTAVGTILSALRDRHLEQDTLVIFVSDNGGTNSFQKKIGVNAPLRLGKLYLFEGGTRIPLLMQWPRVLAKDTVYREPVHSLDLLPTVVAATNAKLPTAAIDGIDLVPYLKQTRQGPPHEFLFWRNGPETRAVRSGKWKLIRSVQGSAWLYDLSTDIGETKNLATQQPAILKWLDGALSTWSAGLKVPAWKYRTGSQTVTIDGQPYRVNI
ncbi:MAG: sulfatase-like hydrolase/transferase [Planctomycetota bacterium]|jgi:arylsulfatase A-like enzyme|nr:sulfatase-like hydrolase/transferase [Planctomycetota bacterium]